MTLSWTTIRQRPLASPYRPGFLLSWQTNQEKCEEHTTVKFGCLFCAFLRIVFKFAIFRHQQLEIIAVKHAIGSTGIAGNDLVLSYCTENIDQCYAAVLNNSCLWFSLSEAFSVFNKDPLSPQQELDWTARRKAGGCRKCRSNERGPFGVSCLKSLIIFGRCSRVVVLRWLLNVVVMWFLVFVDIILLLNVGSWKKETNAGYSEQKPENWRTACTFSDRLQSVRTGRPRLVNCPAAPETSTSGEDQANKSLFRRKTSWLVDWMLTESDRQEPVWTILRLINKHILIITCKKVTKAYRLSS